MAKKTGKTKESGMRRHRYVEERSNDEIRNNEDNIVFCIMIFLILCVSAVVGIFIRLIIISTE